MNVTTKNNALLSETAYPKRYSLPPIFIGAGCLPLGFGQRGDKENRPRAGFFQGKTLFRTKLHRPYNNIDGLFFQPYFN
jgi:hypothetical protein